MQNLVFYRPEQACDADSFSQSPLKPRFFSEQVSSLYGAEVVRSFEPVTADVIKLAHDGEFVDGVLDGTISNGFGNCSAAVAQSLPYTVGSMLAAARPVVSLAPGEARRIACSPTSGFHHSGYDFSGGFCTFNGLVIAAMQLKNEGLVQRVAIVDCDMHYGNGTDEIIGRLGLADWLEHFTGGDGFSERRQGKKYLLWLEQVRDYIVHNDFDLVIYQAGADIHVKDPLGGVLTTSQMRERDAIVFSIAEAGIPLAWNLAGGYQLDKSKDDALERLAPVLDLHMQTYRVFSGEKAWAFDAALQ